jgi:hypothetical protein
LAAVSFLSVTFLLLPSAAQCRAISKTAKLGAFSVTFKVLSAESFTGPKAEMIRDGGAQPVLLRSAEHPNHHVVAFLSEDGKPVESAKVTIRYRRLSPQAGAWTVLPVVQMYVDGKGPKTTHFGNNAKLGPGRYEARVMVDGNGPATFRFSLAG